MANVAVIGYGYWGPKLARQFSTIPTSDLRYVCDFDLARLAQAEMDHRGIATLVDPSLIFEDPDIDAVAIATPVASHFQLAAAALDAGKHVLVEKPVCSSSSEAHELAQLAERNGRVLQVDHTYLYGDPVQRIRSFIESGALGEILYVDSVRVNLGLFKDDHSVVWDLAPHDISIMLHLLGQPVDWVSATGISHYVDFGQPHNLAYASLFFADGTVGHIQVSWLAPVKVRRMTIGGSERMLLWDDVEPDEKVRLYESGVTVDLTAQEMYDSMVQYRLGDTFVPRLDNYEALRRECEEFLTSIETGQRPLSDAVFGAEVVQVIEAIERSILRNGAPVEVAGVGAAGQRVS